MTRPKATKNLAKDVITPKLKQIDIPSVAKAEVARMIMRLDNYLAGVVAGLGIEGRWSFDRRCMCITVEDKK